MASQRIQQNKGSKITVIKFGGKCIGTNGENIPIVVKRIKTIKENSNYGPLVVLSAPQGITDLAIKIGKSYADPKEPRISTESLFSPYMRIAQNFMKDAYKDEFLDELRKCKEIVEKTLELVEPDNFVDRFRARILGYSGEILTAIAFNYILKSQGIDSCHISMENWPIVTDNNFQNANFLLEESSKRLRYLLEPLEQKKVILIGGFIGITNEGKETTFERGGSDRTAADLSILLKECFNVVIDFEKNDIVQSADPKIGGIGSSELDEISHLSYNEVKIAGQFGMKIVDPLVIRDIQESGLEIEIFVTDMKNPARYTTIQKVISDKSGNPIKIVTGKKDCAIIELDKSKRDSLEDYLKCAKRHTDFLELGPYDKEGKSLARFLLLDGEFVRHNEIELRAFDKNSTIEYGLGAITLVGDEMAKVSGIAGKAYGALEENNINVLDGFVQRPTSRVIIVVREDFLDRSVSAIHDKRTSF